MQTFRRCSLRGLTGLALALGASMAFAHERAVQIAVPPSSPLYGTIACADADAPRAALVVHVSLDQRVAPTPMLGQNPASAPAGTMAPVFSADLHTTGHDLASVETLRVVRYVSEVKRPEHGDPVVTFASANDGATITLMPMEIDVAHARATLRLKMESVRLNALRSVDTGAGIPVQVPDQQDDNLMQAVTLKLNDTQDLETPNGVLHLTLKSLSSLPGHAR